MRTFFNIVLDVLIISKYRVDKDRSITVNTQATIRLCCDAAGAVAGLAYFLYLSSVRRRGIDSDNNDELEASVQSGVAPSIRALKTLVRPGSYFFTESAVRNALYLWLVHNIAQMGTNYATVCWKIFILAPLAALRLIFVGVGNLQHDTMGHGYGPSHGS